MCQRSEDRTWSRGQHALDGSDLDGGKEQVLSSVRSSPSLTRSREVRKLFKGIGFTVLRLIRTRIGSIAGPCEQEGNLREGEEGNGEGTAARDARQQPGSTRRAVESGQVLRVGEYRELTEEDIVGILKLCKD